MKTRRIFNIMYIISWIVCIGYSIKAGAIAIVSLISLLGNQKATENLYMGLDLSKLYDYNIWHFTVAVFFLVLLACFKAYIFYQLILIFKTLDLNNPFKRSAFISVFKMSYVAFAIGVLGVFANSYITWLRTKVFFTQIEIEISAYIFMAGVLYIVASLFEHAYKLQSENDLTI